jgi:predicted O-methyltransferase YrrM
MEHFYQNIFGYFNFQEVYSDMVKKFPENSYFVELGSFFGCSTVYLAVEIINSGKNIKFDAIDKWDFNWILDNISVNVHEEFLKNIESVKSFINPIKGFSENIVNNYKDESIDFLFIDADHEYDKIKQDINLWFSKIKKNGVIAGHDYTIGFPGVIKAVDEFFGKDNFNVVGSSWIFEKK